MINLLHCSPHHTMFTWQIAGMIQLHTGNMCIKMEAQEGKYALHPQNNWKHTRTARKGLQRNRTRNLVLNEKILCTPNYPTFLCFFFSMRLLFPCNYRHCNCELLAFDSWSKPCPEAVKKGRKKFKTHGHPLLLVLQSTHKTALKVVFVICFFNLHK